MGWTELDDGGPPRPSHGPDGHPLSRVSDQLNFQHSLVRESQRLRTSMVDALLDIATALERLADTWDRCAQGRPDRAGARYRAVAARTRTQRADVLVRLRRAIALPIGEPRSPWTEAAVEAAD